MDQEKAQIPDDVMVTVGAISSNANKYRAYSGGRIDVGTLALMASIIHISNEINASIADLTASIDHLADTVGRVCH